MTLIGILKPRFNIKNVNVSELGWVRPDKSIIFQSCDVAQKYAKNRVIQALKSKDSFERGILLKDNLIISEINGDNSRIVLEGKLPKIDLKGCEFVHGHPDISEFGATPVSLEDYLTFLGLKLNKMIVYNKEGQFSTIENVQTKFFRFLPKKFVKLLEFAQNVGKGSIAVSEYAKMWSTLFPKDLQKVVEVLIHSNLDNELLVDRKLAHLGKIVQSNQELMDCIKFKTYEVLGNSDTPIKAIDSFWRNNSKRLGYKYSTDFSNLNK